MYRYYNGEKDNPFDKERQNAAFNFWGYEQLFENDFNEGDFSELKWIPTNAPDTNEWHNVLLAKPINKEELFRLWLHNLLMVHLPEKYQSEEDKFLRLYFDTGI